MMMMMLLGVLSMILILCNQSAHGYIFLKHWRENELISSSQSGIVGRTLSRHHSPTTRKRYRHHLQNALTTDTEPTEYERHEYFMTLALSEAERAQQEGEVPIGALVVQKLSGNKNNINIYAGRSNASKKKKKKNNKTNKDNHDDLVNDSTDLNTLSSSSFRVLARSGNSVERNQDASAHAELLALRAAAGAINNWRLQDCILYSTLEPCPMCLAAAQAFRVDQIVYGAPDMRLGAITTHMKLLDDYQHPYHSISSVVPGVLEDQSAGLLRDFFRSRRQEQKQKQKQKQSVGVGVGETASTQSDLEPLPFRDNRSTIMVTVVSRLRAVKSNCFKLIRMFTQLPLLLWKQVKNRT